MVYGSGKYSYRIAERWAGFLFEAEVPDIWGLSIDKQDNIYVFTRGRSPMIKFDRDGNVLSTWDEELIPLCGTIHSGYVAPDGSVFCVDAKGHTISKFSPDGKPLFQMGNKNKPSDTGFDWSPASGIPLAVALDDVKRSGPPFNSPTDITISPSQELFVSDGYGNARIHVFSNDGKLKYSWGDPGRERGQFRVPHSVWVDKHDRVWISDRENDRIQIFDIQGEFIDQWTGFSLPCDIFIDDNETVYVAELNRRISILDNKGKLLARIGDDEPDNQKTLLLSPHSIAVDSHGDIYVGEIAKSFAGTDRKGRVLRKFIRI